MNVLVLTQYFRTVASSRVRFYQYAEYLRAHGISTEILPLLSDACVTFRHDHGRWPIGGLSAAYAGRISTLLRARQFDLLWIQAELFPWLPAWIEALLDRLGIRYVVEYDDAVFHRYDRHGRPLVRTLLGSKIDTIMRRAALVIAGNEYLMDRARRAGARAVEYLPSVVDLSRYTVADPRRADQVTIGWMGSSSTAKYLASAAPALQRVCRDTGARVVLVGAEASGFDGLAAETRRWSEATEVGDIQSFDIGIMPLADAPWERGKCGYKLIQYMACAKPTVASPVGVNTRIVRHGATGFLADTTSEWVAALTELVGDPGLRRRLGDQGRMDVEDRYCVAVTLPRLIESLTRAASERPSVRVS